MSTIRILISSPLDVAEERKKARLVIESLERYYERLAKIEVVMFEDLALSVDMSAQERIAKVLSEKNGIDIAVFILWSRLGSELSEKATPKPGGGVYRSGTEHEFELMLAARRESGGKKPDILAYWREDEKSFIESLKGVSPNDYAKLLEQREMARRFIEERFMDEKGRNIAGICMFAEPISFAQRLDRHLRERLDARLAVDQATPSWTEAPYRSLEVFDIHHLPIFYGRDEETCDVLQRLRDQQRSGCAFVCIVGASGSGKSSLARAGVAATLVQRSFDDGVKEWRAAAFLPSLASKDLFLDLARTLADQLPELREGAGGLERFAKRLEDNHEAAADLLETACDTASERISGPLRLLLVLDQMEELWTVCGITLAEREKFLKAIEALAGCGRFSALATLRSDFYPQAQRSETFRDMKGDRGHFDLAPPGTAALQELIVQPAHRRGLTFQRDERTGRTLDQRILEDAARDPSALPLLQYALAELFERRDEKKRQLTYAAYEAMGGVEGALGHRAAQTFADPLPEDVRTALDELLSLLISVDTGGEQNAVRRRAPLADLTSTTARGQLTERLIKARFLTTDDQSGTPIATLAHEALLRRWDRISTWIDKNRNLLRSRASVEHSQNRWEQAGRNPSLLLPTGLPLEEGRRLIAEGPTLLLPPTALFIETSIAHQETEKRRRAQMRTAVIAGLTLLAGIAGIGAWSGLSGKHIAEAQTARAQSQIHRACVQDLATARNLSAKGSWREALVYLYRAESYEDPESGYARAWLWSAIVYGQDDRDNPPEYVVVHPDVVSSAVYSPDGKRIVSACFDGKARQWDAATGGPIGHPLSPDGRVYNAVYSPDGKRILTVSEWDKAQQWDIDTGEAVGRELHHRAHIKSAVYSPNGSRILTVGDGKPYEAQQWDADTGDPIGKPLRSITDFESASYSPDGTRVVTVSGNHVQQWAAATGESAEEELEVAGLVRSASYSPDGTRIVTASEIYEDSSGETQQWETDTRMPVGERLRQKTPVKWAVYSPDGTRIVTAGGAFGKPNEAQQWEVDTGKAFGEVLRSESKINNVAYSPGGTHILIACQDHTMRQFEAVSGVPSGEPMRQRDSVHGDSVHVACYSPDGTRILTVSKGVAQQWDAASGEPTGKPTDPPNNKTWIGRAAYSPADGRRIVTVSRNLAQQRDATTSKPTGNPLTHEDEVEVMDAAYSPDGTRIVTASGYADNPGYAQQWEASTGTRAGESIRREGSVKRAVYSPDGTRILTVSQGVAQQWEASTNTPVGAPLRHLDNISNAAYSPDGKRIVTAGGDYIRSGYAQQWDAVTCLAIGRPMPHPQEVNSAMYSADGRSIITGCNDTAARQWETVTSKPIGAPLRHQGAVLSASYSPDGTHIVTGSSDETARQWECGSPLAPSPAWMGCLVQVLSGLKFNEDNEIVSVSAQDRLAMRATLRSQFDLAVPSPNSWEQLALWALSSPTGRRYTPGSRFSVADIAERELNSGQPAGIREALRLVPTLPLTHLALAAFAKNDARAAFLRRYDLQRLPTDPAMCRRAAEMLRAQGEPELAQELEAKATR